MIPQARIIDLLSCGGGGRSQSFVGAEPSGGVLFSHAVPTRRAAQPDSIGRKCKPDRWLRARQLPQRRVPAAHRRFARGECSVTGQKCDCGAAGTAARGRRDACATTSQNSTFPDWQSTGFLRALLLGRYHALAVSNRHPAAEAAGPESISASRLSGFGMSLLERHGIMSR